MPMPSILSDGVVNLRPLVTEDLEPMYAAVVESIPEISPWLPWCHPGYTRAETCSFLELMKKAWADGTQCPFGILAAGSGKFLGVISINHIVHTNQLANVGYWVRSTCTKQGIASRAGRLGTQYAFQERGLTRLEIACIPGNSASRRVAEKLGAKLEAISRNRLVMHGRAYDAALYALTPEDIALDPRLGI